MEVYGLIVHTVADLPPTRPQDGTITWHLSPTDGLGQVHAVYVDESTMHPKFPNITRLAYAIVAVDANGELVAAATGVPPSFATTSGAGLESRPPTPTTGRYLSGCS